MKKIKLLILGLVAAWSVSGQTLFTSGIYEQDSLFSSAPCSSCSHWAYSRDSSALFRYNTISAEWQRYLNITQDSGVPSGDPGSGNKLYLDIATGNLYRWDGSAWSTFTADQMNSERQVNTTTTTTTFIIPSVTIPTGFTKIRWLFTHNSSGNTDTITVSYLKIDSVYTITQLNKNGLGVFQSPTTFAKISKGEVSIQGQPIFFGGGTLYVAGDDLWWKKGAVNVKLS